MRDITGLKFGKLTAVRRLPKPNKRSKWECVCECGKIIDVDLSSLHTKNTQSCGCIKGFGKNSNRWAGHEDISSRLWTWIKRAAKVREIDFQITIEEAWGLFQKQGGKCALTGLEICFTPIVMKPQLGTASLDRIDSSKSYTIDNVQWVHKTVNKMKWDLNQEEFVRFCNLVTRNFNNVCAFGNKNADAQ